MAIRYTTPTLTLIVRGVDLSGADAVVVSLRQRMRGRTNAHEVDVDATATYDGTDSTLTVTLTQEQTAGFIADQPVSVQVNWTEDGGRMATKIALVPWGENLLDEVMADE